MTRREASAGILASAALAAAPMLARAEELKPLDLPPPRGAGGQPLIETLKLRRSTREYSDRPLPAQVLSDLLWAAFGVNRPVSRGQRILHCGRRTQWIGPSQSQGQGQARDGVRARARSGAAELCLSAAPN
jgi:hypothetical protein